MARITVRSAAVLAAAAGLAVAGAGCGTGPEPGSRDAQAANLAASAAGEEPWRGSGVVHARFGDGSQEWLDRRGATRHVDDEGDAALVRIQDGRRIVSWDTLDPKHVSVTEVVDPSDPWLEHASQLLAPWRALQAGRAHIVGSGEVDGKPVWIVESDAEPGPDAPPDLHAYVDVDQETYLPLRFRASSGDGKKMSLSVEYDEVSEAALPADFFSTDRAWTSRERRLRHSDLASLPFRVYTLGEEHGAYRIGAATFSEQKPERIPATAGARPGTLPGAAVVPAAPPTAPAPGELFRPPPTLHLGYVRGGPYEEPVVQLHERDAGRARIARAAPDQAAKTYRVPIAGEERTVLLSDADRIVWFAVVVDGTYIEGSAPLPAADVLTMLSNLREVR